MADIAVLPMRRTSTFAARAPSGRYFLRVRPVNVCGSGMVSNEVTVTVP
jgi:hypothetical protein